MLPSMQYFLKRKIWFFNYILFQKYYQNTRSKSLSQCLFESYIWHPKGTQLSNFPVNKYLSHFIKTLHDLNMSNDEYVAEVILIKPDQVVLVWSTWLGGEHSGMGILFKIGVPEILGQKRSFLTIFVWEAIGEEGAFHLIPNSP